MKRKKWSEQEEQTLLSKYSELLSTGALSKLKTREKKFKPIADHVTAVHHAADPAAFPFRWSWRDVSVKVQNMRHQYLGVKQKIRLSDHRFNWPDGVNHWNNFLRYKHVFGDLDLPPNAHDLASASSSDDGEGSDEEVDDARVSAATARRSERAEEEREERELAAEGRRRRRRETEAAEERRRRMRAEERREEEEMEWRERMAEMQMEHERRMMQLHAEACQNQMQLLGMTARLLCQFFGAAADGIGPGLGPLPAQVLQHPGDLGDSGKPDTNSPSEFI